MAHTDFEFYQSVYFGDADLLNADNASRWLERASDVLNTFTFHRLETAFPTQEAHAKQVKKAVCAVAEALCAIDIHRKAIAPKKAQDGSYSGTIASVSSGRESVSYTISQTANAFSAAAADKQEEKRILQSIATQYLANIPDANGVNLLYAGEVRHVPRYNHNF